MDANEIQTLCGEALILTKGLIPKDIMQRVPQRYIPAIGKTIYPYSKNYISFFVGPDLWSYPAADFFTRLNLEMSK